jgi:hypothetical protein
MFNNRFFELPVSLVVVFFQKCDFIFDLLFIDNLVHL